MTKMSKAAESTPKKESTMSKYETEKKSHKKLPIS